MGQRVPKMTPWHGAMYINHDQKLAEFTPHGGRVIPLEELTAMMHQGEMILPRAHVPRPVQPTFSPWKCAYCASENTVSRLMCVNCGAPKP